MHREPTTFSKGDAKSVTDGTEINYRVRPKFCYFIFVDLLYEMLHGLHPQLFSVMEVVL